jgi:hypothetical protein
MSNKALEQIAAIEHSKERRFFFFNFLFCSFSVLGLAFSLKSIFP